MGAFNIAFDYKIVFNYKLYNSVLFNLRKTIYIFNDWVKLVSEIKPILDYIYIDLYIKEIISFGIAIIIINKLKGKERILFIGAAYILSCYTNLIYI